MHIEKIEYGPEKEGILSNISFGSIIILTIIATGITVNIIMKIIFSNASAASTQLFVTDIGKMLAYLLFVLAAILYLYVKGILRDEYVTTTE